MATKGELVVSQAKKYLGVHETSGRNSSPDIDRWEARWGMHGEPWCFVGDTLIDTPNGFAKIQDLSIGDIVITAADNDRQVIKNSSRVSEDIFKLRAHGLDESLVTGEHPYWVRRRKEGAHASRFFYDPEWIQVKNLQTGDLISYPVHKASGLTYDNHDEAVAYLLGRWFGDGWLGKGTPYICGAKSEESKIEQAINDAGYEWHRSQTRTVGQYSIKKAKKLFNGFGETAITKRIPSFVFDWPKELRVKFLEGYVDADGCRRADNHISTSTVNRELALGVAKLSRSLGHAASMRRYAREPEALIEGRLIKQQPFRYIVQWAPNSNHFRWDDSYGWGLIREVEPTNVPQNVYNLTVADDHTFIADGVAVHNCGIFVDAMFSEAGVSDSGICHPSTQEMCNRARNANALWDGKSKIPTGSLWIHCGVHTCLVIEDQQNGNLKTIEGNHFSSVAYGDRPRSGWNILICVPPEVKSSAIPPIKYVTKYFIEDLKADPYVYRLDNGKIPQWKMLNSAKVQVDLLSKNPKYADKHPRVVHLGNGNYAIQLGAPRIYSYALEKTRDNVYKMLLDRLGPDRLRKYSLKFKVKE